MLAHKGQSVASVTRTPPHLPRTTVRHGPEAAHPILLGTRHFSLFVAQPTSSPSRALCAMNPGCAPPTRATWAPLAAWHTPSLRPLAISLVSRYYLDMLRFDWDEPKNRRNRTKHRV